MQLDISKYEVILKINQYGSLSKAAQAMDYTQAAVTHIVQQMEKSWNVQLFYRSYTGVSLTSEGKRLLPLLQDAINAEYRIQREIDDIQNNRRVVIGAFASISTQILPTVIRQFEEQYPDVEFEIRRGHYTQIEQWVLDGEVDIGFFPEPIPEKLCYEPFISDSLQAVIPIGHPLSKKETIDIKDLKDEPFIMLSMGKEKHEIEQIAQESGVSFNIHYWVKDDSSVMAMVECGLGISILHELFLRRNSYNVVIRNLTQPTHRDIMVVYRPETKRSPIIKAFLKSLRMMILEEKR